MRRGTNRLAGRVACSASRGGGGRRAPLRVGRFDARTPVLFYAHPADQAEGWARLTAAHAYVARGAGEAQFLTNVRLLIAAAAAGLARP